jgi:hypothetical protein
MLVCVLVVTWVSCGLTSDLLTSNYSKVSLSGTAYSSASLKIGHDLWVAQKLHNLVLCYRILSHIIENCNTGRSCHVTDVWQRRSMNLVPFCPSELTNLTTPISVSRSEFSQNLNLVKATSSFTRRVLQRMQVGLGVTARRDDQQRSDPRHIHLVLLGLPRDWTYDSWWPIAVAKWDQNFNKAPGDRQIIWGITC